MPTGHNYLCAGENKTIRNFEFLYETSFDQNILSDIYSDILSGMYSVIFSGKTFGQGRRGEGSKLWTKT